RLATDLRLPTCDLELLRRPKGRRRPGERSSLRIVRQAFFLSREPRAAKFPPARAEKPAPPPPETRHVPGKRQQFLVNRPGTPLALQHRVTCPVTSSMNAPAPPHKHCGFARGHCGWRSSAS